MKKQLTISLLAIVTIVGGFLYSCTKESTNEEQITLKAAKVATATAPGAVDMNSSGCTACVANWKGSEVSSSTFYKITGQKTTEVNSVKLTVSNDNEYIYFNVSSATETFSNLSINSVWTRFESPVSNYSWKASKSSWNACDKVQVSLEVQGLSGSGYCSGTFNYSMKELCTSTSIQADKENPVCTNSSVKLTATVSANEAIKGGTITILKDGSPVASQSVSENNTSVVFEYTPQAEGDATFTAEYSGSTGYKASSSDVPVVVTAQNCKPAGNTCTETFDYVQNADGTYTFTYIPSEDMTQTELAFTFAQSDRVTVGGLDDWESDGVTRHSKTDLKKCTTYSWTVTLTPNCSGHSGQSNLWTDFKVGNRSVKGSLKNITAECPDTKDK